VYEGLFEHAPTMQDAVWLFMWLIARTTPDRGDGKGRVLGGIPIRDERPAGELGFPVKTVRRWRKMLESSGYVTLVRTPYGFRYTLLKSKKWEKRTSRELLKRAFSGSESAPNGQSELPQRAIRVPDSGSQSARIGKYKEDYTETTQGINSGQHSASATTELMKGGVAPLPEPTPRRTKPTGRNLNLLSLRWHTDVEIGRHLAELRETIAHYLVGFVHITYGRHAYLDGDEPVSETTKAKDILRAEQSQRFCGRMVEKFERAFEWIEYPFNLSNHLLGFEFCWHVKDQVEAAESEEPHPSKWEVCERVLDRLEWTWRYDVGEASNVGLPYHPNDFSDHIRNLFERETRRTRTSATASLAPGPQ